MEAEVRGARVTIEIRGSREEVKRVREEMEGILREGKEVEG
jgi:hypothetical protein